MRYTDTQLVQVVSSNLTSYQEILIENAASGRAEDQDIVPSLTLDHQTDRLAGRRRSGSRVGR